MLSRLWQQTTFYLIVLTIIAAVPRLLWLDLLPISMAHDELNYILNSKSQYQTGQNIPWTAAALFSWGEKNFDVVISEIPSLITAPWVGPNPLSLFNARLPYAVMAILSVLLVYLITRVILNEGVGRIAGVFMALNPWNIHLGRTALELSPTVFFLLLGTYLMLRYHSWKMLFSLLAFTLGFLCYLGAKTLFLPVIFVLIVYKYLTSQKGSKIPYLTYLTLALLVTFLYFITLNYQPAGTRKTELAIFDQSWTTGLVDNERKQAIPNQFLDLFSNKATVLIKRLSDAYIESFSSTSLFTRGETVSIYSTWEYGQLHHLDFLLIMVGLVTLFAYHRSAFFLIISLIAVAPTISAIDIVQKTYAVRSFVMFPFLVISSAAGFYHLKNRLRFGSVLAVFIGSLYLVSALYFLHLYFFRFPIYSAERWFFSERLAASYARLGQDHPNIQKIYIVTQESPKWVFEEYLFYSGAYNNPEDVQKINKQMQVRNFSDRKVKFLNSCPTNLRLDQGDVLIIDRRIDCGEEESGNHGIVDLKDAGTVMIILNDKLCEDMPNLARYSRVRGLKDLEIEKQSTQTFCRNWISKF